MSGTEYAEAFVALVDLARALGVSRINELPGCWEHQVDDETWVAVNGHRQETAASNGAKVPPYHAYVTVLGWPALFSPDGGTLLAGVEDELIRRLRAATDRAGGESA